MEITTEPKTMSEAIEKSAKQTVSNIVWWIEKENKSIEEASAIVLNDSCLGVVLKEKIINRVKVYFRNK